MFEKITENLIELTIEIWQGIRDETDYDRADWIRNELRELGVHINANNSWKLFTPLQEKPENKFYDEMKRFAEIAEDSIGVFEKRKKDWIQWMLNNQEMLSVCYGFKFRKGRHFFYVYKTYKKNVTYKLAYQLKSTEDLEDWTPAAPVSQIESWDRNTIDLWENFFPDIITRMESYLSSRTLKQPHFEDLLAVTENY